MSFFNTFTVSFFGHRKLNNAICVEARLEQIISELLHKEEFIQFLVGRDGDFDLLCASVIRRMKSKIRDDNSALIWFMPYITSEYYTNELMFSKYYDEIEICEASSCAHYKAAFKIRNQQMVDRSDQIVCFVEHSFGGAYNAVKYAKKQNKVIINIYDDIF